MDFYTIRIKTERGKEIDIKHCSKENDLYLRPVKYRNGDPEHILVEDPDEEIGYDYQAFYLKDNVILPVRIPTTVDASEESLQSADLKYSGCQVVSITKEQFAKNTLI